MFGRKPKVDRYDQEIAESDIARSRYRDRLTEDEWLDYQAATEYMNPDPDKFENEFNRIVANRPPMTDFACLMQLMTSLGRTKADPTYETYNVESGPVSFMEVPDGQTYTIREDDGKTVVAIGPGEGPEWPPFVEFVFDKNGKAVSHSVYG